MIEWIQGELKSVTAQGVIVNVSGVGYGLQLPLNQLVEYRKIGEQVAFWVYTYVREDQLKLFGFASEKEKQFFGVLLSISGVGPKLALAILSTLSLANIQQAVAFDKPEILETVPGIGKRTAERLILELKPKIKKYLMGASKQQFSMTPQHGDMSEDVSSLDHAPLWWQHKDDLRSALENLGFKDKVIEPVLRKIEQEIEDKKFDVEQIGIQGLIKFALLYLREGSVLSHNKKELSDAFETF